MSATPADATYIIVISGLLGIAFAIFQYFKVAQTSIDPDSPGFAAEYRELSGEGEEQDATRSRQLFKLYNQIGEGARAFLYAEYRICAIFLAVFATLGALNSKALRVPASAAMMCTDPRKATFVGRRRFGAR